MNSLALIINIPLNCHLMLGALIRLVLIIYADYHDRVYEVPYTDIDYKVYNDAAIYVSVSESPYKRNTYRYSPLIAYIMLPNLYFGKNFGKLIFSAFDILITIALKIIVERQLATKPNASKIATFCSLFWLYNPMSIGISTRGNADSVSCFFIILSLLFLQTDNIVKGLLRYVCSGILLGIAIHLRLYPLTFSFPMFLSLGEYKINRSSRFRDSFPSLIPNRKQITLAFSCMTTLIVLTLAMYHLYGYDFIFETYLYHLFRKDTRHNFSVLFYHSYLTMDLLVFDLVKNITQIFEVVILFSVSLTFGSVPQTLPFALFVQAVILVTYNRVMTSQYFTWFLSLLPLVIHNFKMKPKKALFLIVLWIAAQGAWLYYAYLLEFKSREVFIFIWLEGLLFFCANVYILGQVINSYKVGYGFGQMSSILHKDTHGF